MTDPLD